MLKTPIEFLADLIRIFTWPFHSNRPKDPNHLTWCDKVWLELSWWNRLWYRFDCFWLGVTEFWCKWTGRHRNDLDPPG